MHSAKLPAFGSEEFDRNGENPSSAEWNTSRVARNDVSDRRELWFKERFADRGAALNVIISAICGVQELSSTRHPASAPREKLCFTWNRRQTKRTLTGFTPCPAALEWCLPVWRGFTVYWHFYRFVQVGYELLIATVSFIILLFGMGSFKKEKGVGLYGKREVRGWWWIKFWSVMAPCGYFGHLFSSSVCMCPPPPPPDPGCWKWPIYLPCCNETQPFTSSSYHTGRNEPPQ